MQTPYYIQRLLNRADFQHVDSECHENWIYLVCTFYKQRRFLRLTLNKRKALPNGLPAIKQSEPQERVLKGLESLERWLEKKVGST
jgi:hypothetical protein